MHVKNTTRAIDSILACVAFFVCARCVVYDSLESVFCILMVAALF